MDGLLAYILAKKYTDSKSGGTTTYPLTFGSKTFDGSSAEEITAEDLGLTHVFQIKGTKETVADLPTTGNTIGDIWFVSDESVGYVWIEDESEVERWEMLGPMIDIVTAISESSTDTQIPSAKCVYDAIGDVAAALAELRGGNS